MRRWIWSWGFAVGLVGLFEWGQSRWVQGRGGKAVAHVVLDDPNPRIPMRGKEATEERSLKRWREDHV